MSDERYKEIVYAPSEANTLGVEAAKKAEEQADRAVPFHIQGEIAEYFEPALPGDIVAILGQTHNFKSGLMQSWEWWLAHQLMEQGRNDEVIVHVDTETVIEHQIAQMYAYETGVPVSDIVHGRIKNRWKEITVAMSTIATIPVYRVGASLGHDKLGFDEIYLSRIIDAIEFIESRDPNNRVSDRPLRIAAVFLDYLQALPFDPTVRRAPVEQQRRLQVRNDVYRIRSAAARFECPFLVGVQARQHLEYAPGPNMLIPGIYDGEETSAIAQRFDRVMSGWMPKVTHTIGQRLEHSGISFTVTDDLYWFRIVKQRGGSPSGAAWPLRIHFNAKGGDMFEIIPINNL